MFEFLYKNVFVLNSENILGHRKVDLKRLQERIGKATGNNQQSIFDEMEHRSVSASDYFDIFLEEIRSGFGLSFNNDFNVLDRNERMHKACETIYKKFTKAQSGTSYKPQHSMLSNIIDQKTKEAKQTGLIHTMMDTLFSDESYTIPSHLAALKNSRANHGAAVVRQQQRGETITALDVITQGVNSRVVLAKKRGYAILNFIADLYARGYNLAQQDCGYLAGYIRPQNQNINSHKKENFEKVFPKQWFIYKSKTVSPFLGSNNVTIPEAQWQGVWFLSVFFQILLNCHNNREGNSRASRWFHGNQYGKIAEAAVDIFNACLEDLGLVVGNDPIFQQLNASRFALMKAHGKYSHTEYGFSVERKAAKRLGIDKIRDNYEELEITLRENIDPYNQSFHILVILKLWSTQYHNLQAECQKRINELKYEIGNSQKKLDLNFLKLGTDIRKRHENMVTVTNKSLKNGSNICAETNMEQLLERYNINIENNSDKTLESVLQAVGENITTLPKGDLINFRNRLVQGNFYHNTGVRGGRITWVCDTTNSVGGGEV
ncbi:MAG: hypothetical protein GY710_20040 [Desulfobacteraceae bacterium]|nr:hypothetical protein [Desulfobacteraceae bacterium]